MPRYRFSWSNLPNELLEEFRELLEIEEGEQVTEFLSAAYGARPQEEFIEDTFDLLREVWLVSDVASREEIATTLRERELGDVSIVDDLEYLRSCRNTSNLRRVVLPVFITLGEQKTRADSFAEVQAGGSGGLPKKSATPSTETSRDAGTKKTSPGSSPLPKKGSSAGISVDENDEDDEDDGEEGDDKKPSDNANNSVDHFRTWLLEAMREMTKKDSLEPDEDGDIPVDFGSSCTYLSPRANPLSVDIYSVLLSDVNQSPALLAAINEANCETLFAKVKYLSEHKQIILHHEIAADSLNEGSLKRHVIHLGRMADSLDSEFKREFGGVMHGIDSREDEQDV